MNTFIIVLSVANILFLIYMLVDRYKGRLNNHLKEESRSLIRDLKILEELVNRIYGKCSNPNLKVSEELSPELNNIIQKEVEKCVTENIAFLSNPEIPFSVSIDDIDSTSEREDGSVSEADIHHQDEETLRLSSDESSSIDMTGWSTEKRKAYNKLLQVKHYREIFLSEPNREMFKGRNAIGVRPQFAAILRRLAYQSSPILSNADVLDNILRTHFAIYSDEVTHILNDEFELDHYDWSL